jgi:hypothetical protein
VCSKRRAAGTHIAVWGTRVHAARRWAAPHIASALGYDKRTGPVRRVHGRRAAHPRKVGGGGGEAASLRASPRPALRVALAAHSCLAFVGYCMGALQWAYSTAVAVERGFGVEWHAKLTVSQFPATCGCCPGMPQPPGCGPSRPCRRALWRPFPSCVPRIAGECHWHGARGEVDRGRDRRGPNAIAAAGRSVTSPRPTQPLMGLLPSVHPPPGAGRRCVSAARTPKVRPLAAGPARGTSTSSIIPRSSITSQL